jgi:hypothetical protein
MPVVDQVPAGHCVTAWAADATSISTQARQKRMNPRAPIPLVSILIRNLLNQG